MPFACFFLCLRSFVVAADFFGEKPKGITYAHFNNFTWATPDDGGPLAASQLEKTLSGKTPPNSNFG